MSVSEIKKLERELRRTRRRIGRVTALYNAAQESADAYALACARVRVLDEELARAVRRNDGARATELIAELKPLIAERDARQRIEERFNARLARVIEKFHKEQSSE